MPSDDVCTCIVTRTGRWMCILHTLACCPQEWLVLPSSLSIINSIARHFLRMFSNYQGFITFRLRRFLWLVCASNTAQQTSNLWAGLLCLSCIAWSWYSIEYMQQNSWHSSQCIHQNSVDTLSNRHSLDSTTVSGWPNNQITWLTRQSFFCSNTRTFKSEQISTRLLSKKSVCDAWATRHSNTWVMTAGTVSHFHHFSLSAAMLLWCHHGLCLTLPPHYPFANFTSVAS